ncbi:SNF2 family N-terminal domain-containing protein, partial [Thamnocephalis sphaerospora]
GGLLADDMGLGKTVTAIALILSSLQESRARGGSLAGGTLIVCPLSVISNWEEQIEAHVVPGTLSLHIHHGTGRLANAHALAQHDIVITTYNLMSLEYSKVSMIGATLKTADQEDASLIGLQQVKWFRIILDEAHVIKEPKTMLCRAACNLAAERRWCLTGTPVQNRLVDLYSLIKFLRIEPFNQRAIWQQSFTRPITRGNPEAMQRLQTLLKYITIRRTKESTLDGRPLLQLPPKEDRIVWLELSKTERDVYDDWTKRAQESVESYKRQDISFSSVLEVLLRLRQACVHPILCGGRGTTHDQASTHSGWSCRLARPMRALTTCGRGRDIKTKMLQSRLHAFWICCVHPETTCAIFASMSATMLSSASAKSSTKLDALLQSLTRERDRSSGQLKSVVFSQWTSVLDLVQPMLHDAHFNFVRLDGTMSKEARGQALQRFRQDSDVTVMLISLRAGGVGLNLTMAQRVYLLDPYWNPAVEQQAIDRIHRLGQQQPVVTMRLLVKDSVEQKIIRLQEYKKRLADISLS